MILNKFNIINNSVLLKLNIIYYIIIITYILPIPLESKNLSNKISYFNKMTNTISIRRISGYEYQEIEYINIDELNKKLMNIIKDSNDVYIQLILNSINLNKFGMIDNSILSKLNKHDFITIIFIEKKEMYYLGNENGKYIMDFKKDNYYKLLEEIVLYYGNQSYDIIKNSSYKELVLLAIKHNEKVLEYVSYKLQCYVS